VLHYQPKVDLESGVITGAEALVRMEQPDRQLVLPAQFVSIAEDSGLIVPIGCWVLREACRQAEAWSQAGLKLGQVAVNISARELHDADLFGSVRSVLKDTGLAPSHLELELPESGLMHDTRRVRATLYALKNLGVQLAFDDFGTGYSSLSFLRRFPIDTLKIGHSFVQDIAAEAGQSTVRAVIAMGESLNQRVVAEGVETAEQMAFLRLHHCAEGQGEFFCEPLAAESFAAVLASGRL
jgi:EAL domain-containing protein (putative c-di-GMP-specific phosphodiesterase class I)